MTMMTRGNGHPDVAGDERSRLMRTLHVEGATRGLSHDDLSGGAQLAFGVASLADLTPAQLRECIRSLREKMPARSEPAPRERHGPANGALRIITGKQRSFIGRLRSELCLTPEQLDQLVMREFGVVGMSEIRTTVEAGKLINLLIGMNRRRRLIGQRHSRKRTCTNVRSEFRKEVPMK